MGRAPCLNKNELKKVPWSPEEDQKLTDYIQKHGHGSWRSLPNNAGLSRCGKSCRLRWMNYLRPDIKRGRFSFEEEETIIQLHRILGNKWPAIAARLPGRTDTEIKNYWNTHIMKRLHQIGIDSSLRFGRSSYNPTQLLISRLIEIKTLLDSKLAEMATINLLLSQYQYPNLPLQAEQHLYDSQNQELLIPCFENLTQEIPAICNSRLLDASDQRQDNLANRDFTENFELEPYRIAESSDFHVANNQSWYSLGSSLSKQELCPTHLSAPLSCINSSNEGKDDGDFSEVFNLQIPELLDVSEFMQGE